MGYSSFNLHELQQRFGVKAESSPLFAGVKPVATPPWLKDVLERNLRMPLVSEKARGELIVMPILTACREFVVGPYCVYSGSTFDVRPDLGLQWECDFILARTDSIPELRAPLAAIVEAKKGDIETGVAQCLAQMIALRMFNEEAGEPVGTVHGCVTSGDVWQFLSLADSIGRIDRGRYYLTDTDKILGILSHICSD